MFIKAILFILFFAGLNTLLVSQTIIKFKENLKWGYKNSQKTIITPEYDTVIDFDKTNQVAMVANKSEFNKVVNPI